MGTIKNVVGIVLILLVLLALISVFLPSTMHVEKARIIHANPRDVFALADNLHQWKYWSPMHQMDPETEWTYNNILSGKGASYTWKSKKRSVGEGRITILESRPNQYLRTEMDFGPKGIAISEMYFDNVPEGVQVKWTLDSKIGWNPVGKYVAIFMKGLITKSYEEGLRNMESYLREQENEADKLPKARSV